MAVIIDYGGTPPSERRRQERIQGRVQAASDKARAVHEKFADIMLQKDPSPYYFSGGEYPIIHGEHQRTPPSEAYLPALGLRNRILRELYGELGTPSARLQGVGNALRGFESDIYSPSITGNRQAAVQGFSRDIGYNPMLTNLQSLAGNVYTNVLGQATRRRTLERQKKSWLDLAGTITPGPVGQIIGGAGNLSGG